MNKINVLFVIWGFEPGGAERVVALLANRLDRTQFRPVLCCLNDRKGLAIRDDVTQYWLQKKPGLDMGIAWRIKDIISRERIDIVNTHLWTANVWGRLAAFLAHVPVVVTEHSVDVWKSRSQRLIDRALAPLADSLVAVSTEVRDFYARKAGVPEKKITVINNGIDVEAFTVVDMPARQPHQGPVIGMVGRLIPDKGHAFFFQAFPAVRQRFQHTTVLVVGDGPERPVLEHLTRELGIADAVTFLGTRTSELAGLYQQCDLIVQPSLREGLSLTLLEALACGKPVVTTSVGGNATIVNSTELGTVVLPRDVSALTTAVLDWLSRPDNPGAADGRHKHVQEHFSAERMVRQTGELFAKVVRA
jgi:glycosyltransferase involved in cell wall biosynthesis